MGISDQSGEKDRTRWFKTVLLGGTAFTPGGGGGGGALIFSYIRRLGSSFGFKIMNWIITKLDYI